MPPSKWKKGLTPLPNTVQTGQDDQADGLGQVASGAYFVMRPDVDGKWHWMLFSKNGRPLAMNVADYNQQNDCLAAIHKMIELADATQVYVKK